MTLDIKQLDNGITFEGKGGELFDAYISKTINQSDLMDDHKSYKAKLGYTDTALLNPDQKFSSRLPNGGLKKITEKGLKNKRSLNFGPKKGLGQVEFGDEFSNTFLFSQWARTAQNLKGANDGIQAELATSGEQAKDLMTGYDITYAETMVKVPAYGFSVSAAEGYGSACARDGLSLFNDSHEYLDNGTTATQSNIVTGAAYTDVATGQGKLQDAIDLLKTMKFDNGKKVKQGKMYTIFCSREKENFWLEVINNGSDKAGTGSNSAKENVFSFRNNLVKVEVLDLLGDSDSDGVTIGTNEMFFVANMEMVTKLQALRCANLYSPRVKTWENDETDELNTNIRAIVGADHFDLEFAMVGSTGIA